MTTPALWSWAKKAHLPAAAATPTLQISTVGHTAVLTLNGRGKKQWRYLQLPVHHSRRKTEVFHEEIEGKKSALCNDIKDKPRASPHVMNSDRGAKNYCRILIDGKKKKEVGLFLFQLNVFPIHL